MPTDERVLRRAITQLLIADLTHEHGWRDGVSYHKDMAPDLEAGAELVRRGVLTRHGSRGLLLLSADAVERALRVAVDAAVADLLANDPPAATFVDELAEDDQYGEDRALLVLVGPSDDTPGVRSW